MFTTIEEYELEEYRMKIKNEILNKSKDFELLIKLILLLYKYRNASSFYGINLKEYLSDKDINNLKISYGNNFNKLYFGGFYFLRYETSSYGFPLVYKTSSLSVKIKRYFCYYMKNKYYKKEINDVLVILLSSLLDEFFGPDGEPTNSDEQINILKKYLPEKNEKLI